MGLCIRKYVQDMFGIRAYLLLDIDDVLIENDVINVHELFRSYHFIIQQKSFVRL